MPSEPSCAATGTELGPEDVREAARFLEGQVRRTRLIHDPELDRIARVELWLKAECEQLIGAFKARGAQLAVGRLDPALRATGVITYSSGNHGQAVALAAERWKVPAIVTMPIDAPAIKVDAVRALGGEVVFAGTTSADRKAEALRIQAERGGVVVPPFDDPNIVCGQGTATLELCEQVAEQTGGGSLDAVLVPVGGGGLVAGACLATAGSSVRVIAVEPEGCDAMARSLEAGRRVRVEPAPTIADGLKPVEVGEINFAIASRWLAGARRVTDVEIGRALATLYAVTGVVVEPSGAAALAAALRGEDLGRPRRVGVILSGGNVAPELHAKLCRDYPRWD